MSEYLRDRDGDVWRVDPDHLTSHRFNGDIMRDSDSDHRDAVERMWGPLVPCAEDGTLLTSEPAADPIRALVAGAFHEFAAEMDRAYWGTDDSVMENVYGRARDAAKTVADGVLSGTVAPAKGPDA
ncbi:hypothetical protein ACFC26_07810 [Kitasatospora purpeofusca]|uniref:hypothetical protein n=1 Tax=Kitasatospora purpeofusca TaxID=67352 RepID=UPI0035D6596E